MLRPLIGLRSARTASAGPATAGFLADHSFFYVFAGDAVTSVGFGLIALIVEFIIAILDALWPG